MLLVKVSSEKEAVELFSCSRVCDKYEPPKQHKHERSTKVGYPADNLADTIDR